MDPEDPGIEHEGDATFYPTGPIDEDTVVVIPSESTGAEGGFSTKACAPRSFLAPPLKWSAAVKATCSYWGTKESVKKTYSWSVVPGSNQHACTQGLGFYRGYNGSQMGVWAKWYNLGCGTQGANAVPWGNTAADPQMKGKSTSTGFATIAFS